MGLDWLQLPLATGYIHACLSKLGQYGVNALLCLKHQWQPSGQLRMGCVWTGELFRGMAGPFWGQLLSPGSWWLHKIKDSASAEVGSRSGRAVNTRSQSRRGGSTPLKDIQRPMTHAQKGPEEWTAHAHSFTWRARHLNHPKRGKTFLQDPGHSVDWVNGPRTGDLLSSPVSLSDVSFTLCFLPLTFYSFISPTIRR